MSALDRRPASKLSTVLTATSATLGAAALVNYLVAKRTESRNPPTGKYITVDGVRLHYIERAPVCRLSSCTAAGRAPTITT